jgi:hypothetical protein
MNSYLMIHIIIMTENTSNLSFFTKAFLYKKNEINNFIDNIKNNDFDSGFGFVQSEKIKDTRIIGLRKHLHNLTLTEQFVTNSKKSLPHHLKRHFLEINTIANQLHIQSLQL